MFWFLGCNRKGCQIQWAGFGAWWFNMSYPNSKFFLRHFSFRAPMKSFQNHWSSGPSLLPSSEAWLGQTDPRHEKAVGVQRRADPSLLLWLVHSFDEWVQESCACRRFCFNQWLRAQAIWDGLPWPRAGGVPGTAASSCQLARSQFSQDTRFK